MFDVLNLVRVNLFLYYLTGRADWQSMMARFRASEFDSVRAFVTHGLHQGCTAQDWNGICHRGADGRYRQFVGPLAIVVRACNCLTR